MQASNLYKSIYTYFGDTTPTPFDCGKLCNKACCGDSGADDDETGMYLFPGEKALFLNHPNYKVVSSDFCYGKNNADIVICKGPCERDSRPLSCRIFPLIPYFRQSSGLSIVRDPRAYAVCPLSAKEAYPYLNPLFIKKTESVFRLLINFRQVRLFLEGLADILYDYFKFEQKGGNLCDK